MAGNKLFYSTKVDKQHLKEIWFPSDIGHRLKIFVDKAERNYAVFN